MRLIKILLCLCFLGCCSVSTPPIVSKAPKLTTEQLVNMTSNATVALISPDNDKIFCSGVYITQTVILTAYHCVEAPYKHAMMKANDDDSDYFVAPNVPLGYPISYSTRNEQTGLETKPTTIHNSHVLSYLRSHDIALLEDKNAPSIHGIATIATIMPAIGERVEIVGHPSRLSYTYVEGIVSQYRDTLPEVEDTIHGPFVQISAPLYFGNSGGGVYNMEGKLIGIASLMHTSNVIGFFIPIGPIYDLIAKTKF